MPTDFTFTGQRAGPANYVGSLMDYVARGYSPALGRFVSADTIVPGAGNPAALNRYAYVYARVLVFSDPTGPDPCGDDWCWRNRWFEAHGYFFDGQDWTRNSSLHARFRDPDILRDVISEVGAAFADGDANWQFSEQSLVGQGIVDFAHRVGGFDRLKELLGNGRTSLVRQHWFWGQRAHTDPPSGRNAYFHDTMFDRPNSISVEYFESNARGTVVHELAHIIDYQYDGLPGRARLRAAVPRQQDPVSDYAIALSIPNILYPGIENWAESATAWVYGNFYLRNSHQPLDVAVGDWIGRVLTGAGW